MSRRRIGDPNEIIQSYFDNNTAAVATRKCYSVITSPFLITLFCSLNTFINLQSKLFHIVSNIWANIISYVSVQYMTITFWPYAFLVCDESISNIHKGIIFSES